MQRATITESCRVGSGFPPASVIQDSAHYAARGSSPAFGSAYSAARPEASAVSCFSSSFSHSAVFSLYLEYNSFTSEYPAIRSVSVACPETSRVILDFFVFLHFFLRRKYTCFRAASAAGAWKLMYPRPGSPGTHDLDWSVDIPSHCREKRARLVNTGGKPFCGGGGDCGGGYWEYSGQHPALRGREDDSDKPSAGPPGRRPGAPTL